MHHNTEDGHACEFPDIVVPPRNENGARAAVLGADGGESYVIAQDRKFAVLNHIEAAIQVTAAASTQIAALERAVRTLDRKVLWISPTVTKSTPRAHLSWLNLLLAVLLSGAGVLGMVVSNVVLSEYALRSASSDLFSNNRPAAILFATLPCLGAVALKVFEARLVSANARWFYGAAVFTVGMVSLVVWLVASAILFSPETAASATLLIQPANDRWIGVVLVLSTIISDVTLGATLLSGVRHLLSVKSNSEAVANPHYAALLRRKRHLEESLRRLQRQRAAAEDYLSRAAAGRELTRLEAEHELERARELWTQVQSAALAFAIAVFLSAEEDDSCNAHLS
jgi:hypothetical protein